MTGIPGYVRWKPLILKHAKATGIPPAFIAAIIEQESGGQPEVVSSAGAVGLMQIMPDFHPDCGGPDVLENPDHNIQCGCKILVRYNVYVLGEACWMSDESLTLTAACYNGGPGNVRGISRDQWPEETQRYATNVLSLTKQYEPEFM